MVGHERLAQPHPLHDLPDVGLLVQAAQGRCATCSGRPSILNVSASGLDIIALAASITIHEHVLHVSGARGDRQRIFARTTSAGWRDPLDSRSAALSEGGAPKSSIARNSLTMPVPAIGGDRCRMPGASVVAPLAASASPRRGLSPVGGLRPETGSSPIASLTAIRGATHSVPGPRYVVTRRSRTSSTWNLRQWSSTDDSEPHPKLGSPGEPGHELRLVEDVVHEPVRQPPRPGPGARRWPA